MDNSLTPILRLYLHRLVKITHKTVYYEGRYGIKAYNKPLFVNDQAQNNIVYLPAETVYLSYDGLKNPYTLVDKCILDSPHVQLMNMIEHGEDIRKSEYVEREKHGYLDGRFEMRVDQTMIDYHIQQFQKTKASIEEGTYDPPKVYYLDNKYYLMDGKHRAAVCGLLGGKLKCSVLPTQVICDYVYTKQLLMKMSKTESAYSQNIRHIMKLMDSRST